MTDIDARLKDMDKVKIDTQVVFPSLFLTTTAEDLRLEAALLRAYNSFLGECSAASKGRIRFAALVPIRDIEASTKEIKRAAKIGAAAVMLHGMAWDKLLGDESLFPFYEEAANLNLPICVHLGWGCPAMTDIFDASTNFYSAILPVTIGFHSILTSAAFERIPNLRFAFLEAGCGWVPYFVRQVGRDNGRRRKAKDPIEYFWPAGFLTTKRKGYQRVAEMIGEDSLCFGSDYPCDRPSGDMVAEFEKKDPHLWSKKCCG
jgi:predicted TIM-barrel fold metal-dependent hydrolase